jgi:hypothetical protein
VCTEKGESLFLEMFALICQKPVSGKGRVALSNLSKELVTGRTVTDSSQQEH